MTNQFPLADYLVDCLEDDTRRNSILAIGGPGAAVTPREQGEYLSALLGRNTTVSRGAGAVLDGVIGLLGVLGRVVSALSEKADLARIGRYYASHTLDGNGDAARLLQASRQRRADA